MTTAVPKGIDVNSFTPYYLQLKQILLDDIEANRSEGDLLPSESELCRRYAVSRTVVRQAFGELDNEGLVLKVKGKGSFVTGRKLKTGFVQHLLGFYDSMVASGHSVTSRILVQRSEPCGMNLAERLEVAVGEDVIALDRVRIVDGRAVQVVRAALPAKLFPGLVDMNLTDRSLYQVLRETYGVRPATGHRSIEATSLSEDDAHHLGTSAGLPALRMESATRSAEGRLFEYYVAVYRWDSFRFELEISSP